ncbi:MAG: aminoacetone oxidase family FAD-binding enzyme [Chloroflexi bacterium]|nr:aminoacetone oxidase family FAD-binding enzyme [Chloroflexota bacterium]
MREQNAPIVIIGAGAAGLMAALWAARGPRPVLVLEGSQHPGQKILISGGGRCNVLPSQAAAADFVTHGSSHALAKILRAWPLAEVRRFFEEDLGVPLRLETETGKLFPASERARTVLDALSKIPARGLTAVSSRGATIRLGARVVGLAREGDGWLVRLASGETVEASRVVLATGGLSVPATGSDGAGLRIAQALGHTLIPTYPALVPLTGSNPAHRGLAGVSLMVTLTVVAAQMHVGGGLAPTQGDRKGSPLPVRGGFLFTHRGYSGPAVLNVSHIVVGAMREDSPQPTLFVQWCDLDTAAWDARLRVGTGLALPLLRDYLPERIAALLLAETNLTEVNLAQLPRADRRRLVEALAHYPLPWTGHEGYKVAEITAGGVPLAQVNPATLESRIAPGLYLCGELLDAFGPIGGYNFLWAWVTGKIAGAASNA